MFRSCACIVHVCLLAGAGPPPPDVPHVLLAAPVNATWAANHADMWLEKGISGFLVQGILDACIGDVWSMDGAPETRGADDALLLEVRTANRRLRQQGIAQNFLHTKIPDDFRGFEDEASASEFLRTLSDLAEFCTAAELAGIALDSDSMSLIYHPNWGGYSDHDSGARHRGARILGRRAFTAFTTAAPTASLLVLCDSAPAIGPLWPSFIAGLLDGARRTRSGAIHLLTRATFDAVDPGDLLHTVALIENYLALRLDAHAHTTWRERGSIAPGLRPLVQPQKGGEIYAVYPREQYRIQLATALLTAPAYVWIESAGQTWWQVAPEEAAVYAPLHQAGQAVAQQTKPLPAYMPPISAASPLRAWRRVMSLNSFDAPTVLAGAEGAAAVVWPGQSLALKNGEGSHAIDLATETPVHLPEPGSTRILQDHPSPMLVAGLSIADRLMPASLWVELDSIAFNRWSAPAPVRYGITNRTPFVLEGQIALLTPPAWTVRPSQRPFQLEPGSGLVVESALRGDWRAGARIDFQSVVTMPGSTPKSRAWTFTVPPRLVWIAVFDTPVAGSPTWHDVNADGRSELLVTTLGGDFVCLNAGGALSWGRLADSGYAFGPVAGRAPSGWHAAASVDRAGTMHLVRGDGTFIASRDLPSPPIRPLLHGEFHESAGEEIVVALRSGLIQAWRFDGVMVWEHESRLNEPFIAPVDGGGDAALACAGAELLLLNNRGGQVARAALPGVASCAPLARARGNGAGVAVIVGTVAGTLLQWDDGDLLVMDNLDLRGPIHGLQFSESGHVIVADAAGVHSFGDGFHRDWSYEADGATTLTVATAPGAPGLLIGRNDLAQVLSLNADGVVQWLDPSALWGPLTPSAIDVRGGHTRYAYGSGDGAVRVREFGPPAQRSE